MATGYLTLLNHIEKTPSTEQPPLYVFCETGEHQWGTLGELIHETLSSKGLVSKEEGPEIKEDAEDNETETGTQSRAHADLLRRWGWVPKEKQTVEESVVEDIEYMIKEGQI